MKIKKPVKYVIHHTKYQKGSYVRFVKKGLPYLTNIKRFAKTFNSIREARLYITKNRLLSGYKAVSNTKGLSKIERERITSKYGNVKYDVIRK